MLNNIFFGGYAGFIRNHRTCSLVLSPSFKSLAFRRKLRNNESSRWENPFLFPTFTCLNYLCILMTLLLKVTHLDRALICRLNCWRSCFLLLSVLLKIGKGLVKSFLCFRLPLFLLMRTLMLHSDPTFLFQVPMVEPLKILPAILIWH